MTYTEKQKSQARDTDIIDFLSAFEGLSFKRKGNGYACVEHDSLYIRRDRRGWYWNSQNKGGSSAIDYCEKIKGMSFPQALQTLVGDATKIIKSNTSYTPELKKSQEFSLPEKTDGQYSRVYAYLNKSRKIDSCIISKLMNEKKIYQDKNNNVIFVGFDEQNKAKFACRRGTLSKEFSEKSFRGDCSGSDKKYSFNTEGKNKEKLYVLESPIDLLSHATLVNKALNNTNAWLVHNRLSLAGTTDVALEHYLKRNTNIKELIFCLDNDEAGQKATAEHMKKYKDKGYKVSTIVPKNKDLNEDLIEHIKKSEVKKVKPPTKRTR